MKVGCHESVTNRNYVKVLLLGKIQNPGLTIAILLPAITHSFQDYRKRGVTGEKSSRKEGERSQHLQMPQGAGQDGD